MNGSMDFFIIITVIIVWMYMYVYMDGSITHIWKSKENMWKLVLSIHDVGSGYQTQLTCMPNTFPAEQSP